MLYFLRQICMNNEQSSKAYTKYGHTSHMRNHIWDAKEQQLSRILETFFYWYRYLHKTRKQSLILLLTAQWAEFSVPIDFGLRINIEKNSQWHTIFVKGAKWKFTQCKTRVQIAYKIWGVSRRTVKTVTIFIECCIHHKKVL